MHKDKNCHKNIVVKTGQAHLFCNFAYCNHFTLAKFEHLRVTEKSSTFTPEYISRKWLLQMFI